MVPMRTTVVLPPEVYARIRRIARENFRSAHQQLVLAISQYVEAHEQRRTPAPSPEANGTDIALRLPQRRQERPDGPAHV